MDAPFLRRISVAVGLATLIPVSLALAAPEAAPANLLTNPKMEDRDNDLIPDKWKSSAPANNAALKVETDASGGVKILDQDKNNGVGLAQYVPVTPGHKYKLTVSAKGTGTLWYYLQFLDKVPAREGDIDKHRLTETRQSISDSADYRDFSIQATAPALATQARIWFYCPRIGVTEAVVKQATLENLGADPGFMATVAPLTGATAMSASPQSVKPAVNLGPVNTVLANPDLKDADGDNLPDGWRVFPSADGAKTKVSMAPGGGVQIVDTDKESGVGLLQQLPAREGNSYSLAATVKGSGHISFNLQFLNAEPAREGDIGKITVGSKQIYGSGTAEGKETTLTAVAPPGTRFLRAWFYCPRIGITDVVVDKVRLTSSSLAPGANPFAKGKLLFVGDFESNSFDNWLTQFPNSTKGQVVTSPVRAGIYAARNEITYADFKNFGDSRNRRSELYTENVGRPGEERWYGFSIYLPEGWTDEMFDIVMQIHSKPDPGEEAKSPILTLETQGPDWKVYNRFDKLKISKPARHGAGGTITTNRVWMGPFETNKWTDWVFHVKWSLEDDGLIEVWKDGLKVAERKGPNGYNEDEPYYLKIGAYKPGYRSNSPATRVIFHDEVRIGNERASLTDVSPGSTPTR